MGTIVGATYQAFSDKHGPPDSQGWVPPPRTDPSTARSRNSSAGAYLPPDQPVSGGKAKAAPPVFLPAVSAFSSLR